MIEWHALLNCIFKDDAVIGVVLEVVLRVVLDL